MSDQQKKERPDLGAAFIRSVKDKPTAFDMSGNIVIEGKKYNFGAYKQKASGKGKLKEGTEFYTFFRIDLAEGQEQAADTSFDPASLE